jgi:hypothetical protein
MIEQLAARLMQATELEMMRICHVIRVVVGFSKKVVFKLMKVMKNGALWLKYSVDGCNCSTFAKALKVVEVIKNAHISIAPIAHQWFIQQAGKFGVRASNWDDVAVKVEIEGKAFYVTTDVHDNYNLFANSRMISARRKTKDAASMIEYIVSNYDSIN